MLQQSNSERVKSITFAVVEVGDDPLCGQLLRGFKKQDVALYHQVGLTNISIHSSVQINGVERRLRDQLKALSDSSELPVSSYMPHKVVAIDREHSNATLRHRDGAEQIISIHFIQ